MVLASKELSIAYITTVKKNVPFKNAIMNIFILYNTIYTELQLYQHCIVEIDFKDAYSSSSHS
jgi:hypothetical protein